MNTLAAVWIALMASPQTESDWKLPTEDRVSISVSQARDSHVCVNNRMVFLCVERKPCWIGAPETLVRMAFGKELEVRQQPDGGRRVLYVTRVGFCYFVFSPGGLVRSMSVIGGF